MGLYSEAHRSAVLQLGFHAWYQCLNGYFWAIPSDDFVLEGESPVVITLREIVDVVPVRSLYCLVQVGDEGFPRHDWSVSLRVLSSRACVVEGSVKQNKSRT